MDILKQVGKKEKILINKLNLGYINKLLSLNFNKYYFSNSEKNYIKYLKSQNILNFCNLKKYELNISLKKKNYLKYKNFKIFLKYFENKTII